MKITARINGENGVWLSTIKNAGITAKMVKGGIIVDLPHRDAFTDQPDYYIVPMLIDGAKLFLEVTEYGGGMTNTGQGTIICGLSGKALRPYYIPNGGDLSNKTHAYFSVLEAVVTITSYRQDSTIAIEEHRIVREGGIARIETKRLWDGHLGELPNTLGRYQAAATAAEAKSNCYHCRHAHYVVDSK